MRVRLQKYFLHVENEKGRSSWVIGPDLNLYKIPNGLEHFMGFRIYGFIRKIAAFHITLFIEIFPPRLSPVHFHGTVLSKKI